MSKKSFYLFLFFFLSFSYSLVAQAQSIYPDKYGRICSLSVIWKEMHYNFAFPENLKATRLDSLYKAYLPKVEMAKDEYEYFKILSSFMAHFDEAHTRVYTSRRPDDMPPVILTNIGKRVLVKNVSRRMAKEMPIGSEIVKVNDQPVLEYLNDSVFPYIGAATPHWKFDKAVTEMLYGRPKSEVKLTIISPKGKISKMSFVRDYLMNGKKEQMADTIVVPPLEIRILKDKIGYIHLSTCEWSKLKEIHQTFNENLSRLLGCKGLIVDLRGNRGGTDEAWYPLAFHLLADKSFDFKGKWLCRTNISSYKMYGEHYPQMRAYYDGTAMRELPQQPYQNDMPDSLIMKQPVIVLSGQYVGSAAEDFLLLMKEQKRVTIVGGPSIGCIGEPMSVPLSGNYKVMLCVKKYTCEDGSQPNVTGILPDIEITLDYDSYRKGKDNQLEFAIRKLEESLRK